MTKRWRLVLSAVAVLAVLAGSTGAARSALPGANGRIAFTSDRTGSTELWTIDPAGGALTQLTTFGPNSNPVETPAWSPDGDEIAFSQGGYVFAYDVTDATVRPITDINSSRFETEPAWSPDGSMLAVTSVDGIWRENADGSGLVQLTEGADRDPAWSPAGDTMAFTRNGGLVGEHIFLGDDIYLMNGDGSGQVRLTSEFEAASDPAWSPDGSKIAYASRRIGGPLGEQTDIIVRDVDDPDGATTDVTSFTRSWSPTPPGRRTARRSCTTNVARPARRASSS